MLDFVNIFLTRKLLNLHNLNKSVHKVTDWLAYKHTAQTNSIKLGKQI